MKRLAIFIALLASIAAHAQTTWNQNVFTNHGAGSVCSSPVRNINQASHWVNWVTNVSVTGGNIQIKGGPDTSHLQAISNLGDLGSNLKGIIQAGGYYPVVEVCIVVTGGGGAQLTADYYASTGVIPTPGGAGYDVSTLPVTMFPAQFYSTNSTLVSTAQTLAGASIALYSISVQNPNAGTVFVAVGNSTTLFADGTGGYIIPVAGSSSVNFAFPAEGIYLPGPTVYYGCSTSSTSAVDPGSACFVSALYKNIGTPAAKVPN